MTETAVAWSEVAREWREREYTRLREAVERLPGIRTDLLDDLLDGTPAPSASEARAVLRGAFAAAAKRPGGAVLLATYVYGLCLDKWERAQDYARIGRALEALHAEASRDSELVGLVVEQAQCLKDAMAVENAMNCSCPVDVQRRAAAVTGATGSLLDRERALAAELGGPAELLRRDAETQHLYFDAVRQVASSILEFLKEEMPARRDFDDIIRGLEESERAVAGDVYESELRGHRAALVALRECAPLPRVHVDAAEVVYVYPFALTGEDRLTGEVLVERSMSEARGWQLGRPGLHPIDVHTLQLTDVWERADRLEQVYAGVSVRLPDISVTTTAEEVIEYTAEVRLSRLGNHYLRIQSRLDDATLHEVNQALRRASPSMGEERLVCGGEDWTKFTRFAGDVMDGVADALSATVLGDPTADFHVVLAAREMSIRRSDGSSAPADLAELSEAVGGSLLFHPVRHLATSLEEWVRYPAPKVENLLNGAGYVGDLAMRTANTTVLYMPTSPEWVFDECEELVEFVASVPPLFTAWESQIVEHARELQRDLPVLEEAPPESVVEILKREGALRKLQADVRQHLALLHSPRLVRDRIHRDILDRLWAATGLPSAETEVERQLEVISTLHERLSAMASGIAEENRRRTELYVQLALGLIAAASLAELLGWINDAFDVQARGWAWMEAGFLVVTAVAVVFVILKQRGSR